MIKKVSEKTEHLYKKYQNLPFKVKGVSAPYFKNSSHRSDIAVFVGKGSPDEIVEEAYNFAHIEKISIDNMSPEEIREYLLRHNLGIDCSGFISNILHIEGVLDKLKINTKNIFKKLLYKRKKRENISIKILLNQENAFKIDWKNIKPYDIISSHNKKHGLFVSKVEYDDNNAIKSITYWHSTLYYGDKNGIREGVIKIIDSSLGIDKQEWLELDESGKNHTLKGVLNNEDKDCVYRLRAIESVKF